MKKSIRKVLLAASLMIAAAVAERAQAQSNSYLEAGIPATNRVWLGPDYERAAGILASGSVDLPRYDDEAGRDVLLRLTSLENFALANNRTLAIGARLNDTALRLNGAGTILKLYLNAATNGAKVNRELVQLSVFLLHNATILLPMLDEFAASIPDFYNQPIRVEGRRKAHAGVVTMFAGAEVSLSETDFYSTEDVSYLLQGMADTLPALKVAFTPEYREELRIKLNEHRARLDGVEDRAILDRMLLELGAE